MRIRLAAALILTVVAFASTAEAQHLPKWLSKLSVHGYVNQAYAVSDDFTIFGIPTDGTTDYRDLALQFRYDQDTRNAFIVQIRQERLGDSPLSELTGDVELDWAFYQRQVNDSFAFKAGRIPLPLGIFNETQGAGTTFPFYRPSNEFYFGQYTSKTLEGVLTSFSSDAPRGWGVNLDAYYGQWALLQQYEGQANKADAKNAFGGQLWLNTPIEGLRFGAGAYRCTVQDLIDMPAGSKADFLMLHGSVEADFDRWIFASEYLEGDLDVTGRYRAAYAQVGTYLTKRISIHGRAALARISISHHDEPEFRADVSEDLGVALNYAFHPSLLFKVEGHLNDGLLSEAGRYDMYAAPVKTRYFIASIAATF